MVEMITTAFPALPTAKALVTAAQRGCVDVVQALLDANAEVGEWLGRILGREEGKKRTKGAAGEDHKTRI